MSNPEAWVTLATLTVLEIVLGIDNIIFLTILVAKVPKQIAKPDPCVWLGISHGSPVFYYCFPFLGSCV